MKNQVDLVKGIHPGIILERELKKRELRKGSFALSLQEYPQTIVSITKGKRRMNTALALKIEHHLGLEEGLFMTLQVYHDIEQLKSRQSSSKPNLNLLRKVLFWDTSMDKIDWQKQKKAVIQRVFERGNDLEKAEMERYYGLEVVQSCLNRSAT